MKSETVPVPEPLETRIAALEAENATLQEALATVTCAFCGQTDRRMGRRAAMEAMAAHVLACEKHPLRAVYERVELLSNLLAELAYAAETLCQAQGDPDCPDCAEQVRQVIAGVRAAGVEVP